MPRAITHFVAFAACFALAACADDDPGARDSADAGTSDSADAGTSDAAADAAADARGASDTGAPDAPLEGEWSVGMQVAELGGLSLPLQISFGGVTGDAVAVVELRVVAEDGSLSDPIGSQTDMAIAEDGTFAFDPGVVTIPAEFSPIGAPVDVQAQFLATTVEDAFFCGDVRGMIPAFAVAIEASTFGAIPWNEQDGVTLPTSCDWTPEPAVEREVVTIGPEERTAPLELPNGFENRERWPIVVVLHGRQATGDAQAGLFALRRLQDELGYLLIVPDGTRDANGDTFWNATPSCCDYYNSGVDDLAWLRGLIEETIADHRGDADDVVLMGHSNGGFMAHRMACDASDLISGIISLAGATFVDADRCAPDEPVSVLNIHGTADTSVEYGGSTDAFAHPSAEETTARWVALNSCAPLEGRGTREYVESLEGEETRVSATDSCNESAVVALWTVEGGSHIPPFDAESLTRDAMMFLRSETDQ